MQIFRIVISTVIIALTLLSSNVYAQYSTTTPYDQSSIPQYNNNQSTTTPNPSINSTGSNETTTGGVLEQMTFIESGLTTGWGLCWPFWSCNVPSWSVNINNLEYNSTTNAITLSVPDGTYPYTVKAPDGYTVTSSTNPVQVSGGAVDVTIQFVKNQ